MRPVTVLVALSVAAGALEPAGAATRQHDRERQQLGTDPRLHTAFEVLDALEPRTRREHIALTQIAAPPFGDSPWTST